MHAYAELLESRVRDEQTRVRDEQTGVRELEGDIHISAETRFRNEQARQLSETQLFKDNQSLFRDSRDMLEDIKGMARELELSNQAIRSLEHEVRAFKQFRDHIPMQRQTIESQKLEDGYPSTLCLRYASSC
jgi:RecJ-like exonuclease